MSTSEDNDGAASDLAPVKTLPAQLNRSATTSYVIHRTFEDFQRLSEMVLNLQSALMTAPGSIPQGPELTALTVRHPHAGLYQTLLKQFSQAKANQRAFDASSTTHGFNEEGAFERILELNQYLEDVWFWLLPENTPEFLNLSVERHDIMQWLKPSASSSHADGRQMRERSDQPLTTITRPTPQIAAATMAPPVAETISNISLNDSPEIDKVQDEGHDQQQRQQEDRVTRAPERMSSVSSIPSLSSSSSFSVSSTTSMTTMSEAGGNDLREEEERNNKLHQGLDDSSSNDIHHLEVVMQGSPHTLSTMAGSTLAASSDVQDAMDNHHLHHASDVVDAAIPMTPVVAIEMPSSLPSFSRHGTIQRRHLHRNNHLGPESSVSSSDVKLKRRMSFSQVFKSLTMPISSSHHNHRHSQYDAGTSREVFDEDVYIWNTVTTKNLPKPTVVA
ncbi:hypothetical protein BGX24_011147 [Mortierella sp. AD032]|nr:hypothetical protein BGX24_011147 [Mortierella sp. AD032]